MFKKLRNNSNSFRILVVYRVYVCKKIKMQLENFEVLQQRWSYWFKGPVPVNLWVNERSNQFRTDKE